MQKPIYYFTYGISVLLFFPEALQNGSQKYQKFPAVNSRKSSKYVKSLVQPAATHSWGQSPAYLWK